MSVYICNLICVNFQKRRSFQQKKLILISIILNHYRKCNNTGFLIKWTVDAEKNNFDFFFLLSLIILTLCNINIIENLKTSNYL